MDIKTISPIWGPPSWDDGNLCYADLFNTSEYYTNRNENCSDLIGVLRFEITQIISISYLIYNSDGF